jgi:tRNA(His) 5'-end guanylyltransferase
LGAKRVDDIYAAWNTNEDEIKYADTLLNAMDNYAMFDARCFNLPKEEVANLIYWRQLDATRNSIQMVGQALFSHSQLQGKSCNKIQDMLMEEYGINWNNYPTYQKRGSACYKKDGYWYIDKEMPIIKGADRQYVEQHINFDEE